jgi:hypothetical protein
MPDVSSRCLQLAFLNVGIRIDYNWLHNWCGTKKHLYMIICYYRDHFPFWYVVFLLSNLMYVGVDMSSSLFIGIVTELQCQHGCSNPMCTTSERFEHPQEIEVNEYLTYHIHFNPLYFISS